jgi:sugar lactone lactonase YvrE
MTPVTLPTGTAPNSVTIDPLGKALYATDRANSVIYQYAINSTTGVLTAMTSATVPAGLHPTSMATGY